MKTLDYLNEQLVFLQNKEQCLDNLKEILGIKYTCNYKYGLVTLNYSQIDSPKTHPIVVECRSLVLDLKTPTFEVVSRSFDRFLNLGENQNESKIDITKMTAYEKLDGSLIGLFFHNGEWLYRTKSMIMPEGEMYADAFGNTWKDLIEMGLSYPACCGYLNREVTYIFELVSPYNRVVVRYEDTKVYLLARRLCCGEYL